MDNWRRKYVKAFNERNMQVYSRNVYCGEYTLDKEHTVVIMERSKTFDVYLVTGLDGNNENLLYMFSLPIAQQRYSKVIELALTRAPEYYTEVSNSEES